MSSLPEALGEVICPAEISICLSPGSAKNYFRSETTAQCYPATGRRRKSEPSAEPIHLSAQVRTILRPKKSTSRVWIRIPREKMQAAQAGQSSQQCPATNGQLLECIEGNSCVP